MLWWHWVIFGLALLAVDVFFINAYFMMWFGIGAAIVGGVAFMLPDVSLTAQILLFTIASAALLAGWLLGLRPWLDKKALAAAKDDLIGIAGAVINCANGRGRVRLQKPVGGRDVWRFTAVGGATPRAGDRVTIESVDNSGVVIVSMATESSAESSAESPAKSSAESTSESSPTASSTPPPSPAQSPTPSAAPASATSGNS